MVNVSLSLTNWNICLASSISPVDPKSSFNDLTTKWLWFFHMSVPSKQEFKGCIQISMHLTFLFIHQSLFESVALCYQDLTVMILYADMLLTHTMQWVCLDELGVSCWCGRGAAVSRSIHAIDCTVTTSLLSSL